MASPSWWYSLPYLVQLPMPCQVILAQIPLHWRGVLLHFDCGALSRHQPPYTELYSAGTSNSFEIRTKSSVAGQYNNQSVLENMHISHLWKLIENHPQCNFLEGSKDRSKAKQIVARLILNTDMSFHTKNLELLRQTWRSKQFNPKQNS